MESLTLHSHVLAAMSMGFSDRRKDLRGFFFDGENPTWVTTPWLNNFAAVVMPMSGLYHDERAIKW